MKDESGITLVELLAALTILMVVILLAGSIHLFGQRQFISQTDSASQANDFSYALTDMTTEIRKRSANEVTISTDKIDILNIVEDGENDILISYTFDKNTGILKKNHSEIAKEVDSFITVKDDTSIDITLTKTNQTAGNKHYHTTIYFRGE